MKLQHKINPHKKINLAELRQKRDFEILKQQKKRSQSPRKTGHKTERGSPKR
jgi:hypothetical protein